MFTYRGKACLILLFLIFYSMWFCPVNAVTITVDDDGAEHPGADYTTVQAAIDAASASDTVEVYAGTYTENVLVDKSITLTGVGDPVIDAEGVRDGLTISAPGCTVEGFTIINGGSSQTGIGIASSGNTVQGNTVNYFGTSIGMTSVDGNTVTQNTLQYCQGHGIYLEDSDDNLITENVVTGHIMGNPDDYPIYVSSSTGNEIYSNTLNFGLGDSEIIIKDAYDDAGLNINKWYNDVTQRGNQYGDYTGVDEDEDGVGDTPYYIDPFGGGAVDPYPLMSEAPPTPEAPTIYDYTINHSPRAVQARISWMTDQADSDHRVFYWSVGEYDDGQWSDWVYGTDSPSIKLVGLTPDTTYYYKCYSYNGDDLDSLSSSDTKSFDTWPREPTTITVDDDPGADYTTIQEAVDAAQAEDTILVYSGTYEEYVVVDKTLFFKGDGYPVVSGDSDALLHLKKDDCKVDGFSFNCSKLTTPGEDNAGIWIGYSLGAPLYLPVDCGNATISDCWFNNTCYGVYVASSDNVTVSGCHFVPWGKGVYVKSAENAVVDQSTFYGLGVFVENSKNSNITGSWFNDDRGNYVIKVSPEGAYYNVCQGNDIVGNTSTTHACTSTQM